MNWRALFDEEQLLEGFKLYLDEDGYELKEEEHTLALIFDHAVVGYSKTDGSVTCQCGNDPCGHRAAMYYILEWEALYAPWFEGAENDPLGEIFQKYVDELWLHDGDLLDFTKQIDTYLDEVVLIQYECGTNAFVFQEISKFFNAIMIPEPVYDEYSILCQRCQYFFDLVMAQNQDPQLKEAMFLWCCRHLIHSDGAIPYEIKELFVGHFNDEVYYQRKLAILDHYVKLLEAR